MIGPLPPHGRICMEFRAPGFALAQLAAVGTCGVDHQVEAWSPFLIPFSSLLIFFPLALLLEWKKKKQIHKKMELTEVGVQGDRGMEREISNDKAKKIYRACSMSKVLWPTQMHKIWRRKVERENGRMKRRKEKEDWKNKVGRKKEEKTFGSYL